MLSESLWAAAAVLLAYALFCVVIGARWQRRQPQVDTAASSHDLLIAYASQGGAAERIARQSAAGLHGSSLAVRVLPLNRVDEQMLRTSRKALFVVSTYGEGEAPDNGARFLPRIKRQSLPHLSFAVLALGDSRYRLFCGFGYALHQALNERSAQPLFDPVVVDREDTQALDFWQHHLSQLGDYQPQSNWQASSSYQPWQLVSRRCLNPQSPGAPVYYLQCQLASGADTQGLWQAGDIAEILPANNPALVARFLQAIGRDGNMDVSIGTETASLNQWLTARQLPTEAELHNAQKISAWQALGNQALVQTLPELPFRSYSIASTATSGKLDLLVRQVRFANGEYGLGSGWLTHHLTEGGSLVLRVRAHSGFHAPDVTRPMIMIGNGTGIAGLRAHIQARAEAGRGDNWLLFGERTRAHDGFFADELKSWQAEGILTRVDLAFSRDAAPGEPRYVQHLLDAAAEELRSWVERGAAIYVCGSLQGMAPEVDRELERLLGAERLHQLSDDGRYCRDVY